MEKQVFEIEDKWLLSDCTYWNWSNSKRYTNYLAIVTRNENGEFQYRWLKVSSEQDEFFSIAGVQAGDILMFGSKDTRKGRPYAKAYAKVLSISDREMTVAFESTYRRAKDY